MSQRKRYLQLVLLSVAVILGVLGCLAFLKFRNSVRVSPSKEYSVDEQVVLYRQDNEEWADNKLGESTYSMAGSGCLVSCIASAVSNEGNVITPGELNIIFSENNVYDAEGNIQWGQILAMSGYQVEVFETPSNDCIEECLNDGKYPIVRVRMRCDLCLVYRPNVEKNDRREEICKVFGKVWKRVLKKLYLNIDG